MKRQKRAESADVMVFYAAHLLFVFVMVIFAFLCIEYNIQIFKNNAHYLSIVDKMGA